MHKGILKPGDVVVFREWRDMVEEFEVDDDGDIYIEDDFLSFTTEMSHLCGTQHTVLGIYEPDYYENVERIEIDNFMGPYSYSPGMFDLVSESTTESIDIDFDDLFSAIEGEVF